MYDRYDLSCPECDTKIKEKIVPPVTLECHHCKKRFEVLGNKETSRAVFVRLDEEHGIVHPLFLPAGSIRALTTILVCFSSWVLLLKGDPVPDYLYSLLLGIIGYYFAFRKGAKAEGTYLYEKREKKTSPLFLPAGVIRFFLIAGFLLVSAVLANADRLGSEFFNFTILLWGLVIGNTFARLAKRFTAGKLSDMVNHAKGLLVVTAALWLFVVMTGGDPASEHTTCLVLAATISFYFGSKT